MFFPTLFFEIFFQQQKKKQYNKNNDGKENKRFQVQQLKSAEQVALFRRHKKQYNKNNDGKENKRLQQLKSAGTSCSFRRHRAFVNAVPQRSHKIKAAARFWLYLLIDSWRHSSGPSRFDIYYKSSTNKMLSHFGLPILTPQIQEFKNLDNDIKKRKKNSTMKSILTSQ